MCGSSQSPSGQAVGESSKARTSLETTVLAIIRKSVQPVHSVDTEPAKRLWLPASHRPVDPGQVRKLRVAPKHQVAQCSGE